MKKEYFGKVFKVSLLMFFVLVIFGITEIAKANHSWEGYHWGRTTAPFTLKLGNNVASTWDVYLATASSKWNLSTVLDTAIVPGLSSSRNCRASSGRVEVCNNKYGNNGWLGIASIWISGGHITAGTVKLNDTYFNTKTYNKPAWRNLVMCQEVAHVFGLDHQDEDFDNANLGTCMDYTNDPDGKIKNQPDNQFPNTHDYEELEIIYGHLDGINTLSQTSQNASAFEIGDTRSDWGRAVKKDKSGKDSVFERDLGKGNKILTHVLWVE